MSWRTPVDVLYVDNGQSLSNLSTSTKSDWLRELRPIRKKQRTLDQAALQWKGCYGDDEVVARWLPGNCGGPARLSTGLDCLTGNG